MFYRWLIRPSSEVKQRVLAIQEKDLGMSDVDYSTQIVGLQVRTGAADHGIGINGKPYLTQEDYLVFVKRFFELRANASVGVGNSVMCILISDSSEVKDWILKVRWNASALLCGFFDAFLLES